MGLLGDLADALLGPADDGPGDDDAEVCEVTGLAVCPDPDPDCPCDYCSLRWRQAVHEAGHLVAFEAYDQAWEYATLELEGAPMVSSVVDTDNVDGWDAYVYLLIGHAGHAAEQALIGDVVHSSSDLQMCDDLQARLDDDADDRARQQAGELIGGHLGEVEGLAERLFDEGTIYP